MIYRMNLILLFNLLNSYDMSNRSYMFLALEAIPCIYHICSYSRIKKCYLGMYVVILTLKLWEIVFYQFVILYHMELNIPSRT